MRKSTRMLVYGAVMATLYLVLTHLQNIIWPESATMAVQFRISECLCVLAFFTPAAIPGLTVGCLLFNLTFAGTLPLDFLVGSLATLMATWLMWKTRGITVKGIPVLGMAMPAVTNAILVGWELAHYIGGGFFFNAFFVAIGELAVLYVCGTLVYLTIKKRKLDARLFA